MNRLTAQMAATWLDMLTESESILSVVEAMPQDHFTTNEALRIWTARNNTRVMRDQLIRLRGGAIDIPRPVPTILADHIRAIWAQASPDALEALLLVADAVERMELQLNEVDRRSRQWPGAVQP